MRRLSQILCAAVLAAAASGSASGAPEVGPQQRIDVAGGDAAANETSGAVSHVNPDEITASWNDWRDSPAQGEIIRAGVALSIDGGATWEDFLVRPPAGFQSNVEGDPMTAYDPRTGTLWVGAINFSGNGGLFVARKDPGQGFFQSSVMAATGTSIDKGWMVAGRNELTPDSTRLYIAYNFGVVRSDDFGDTWSAPVSLGSGLGFLPRIGPAGELYVAYWSFGNETFALKRSLDGGASFVTRTIASRMDTWSVEEFNTRFPGTFRVAPLVGLAVDPDDGTLYAVWPDTTELIGGQANVDVYFSRSVDSGDSWSTPVVINGEGPHVGDQFFPWIEADPTGRLHVLYLDSRNASQSDNVTNGMIDAYYAYSENQGQSWTELRLTPQPWNSDNDGLDRPAQFIGDYLGMGVTDTKAWPIYPDTQNGDLDTYTNRISFCDSLQEVTALTLAKSEDESTLTFHWADQPAAEDYVLLVGSTPEGPFMANGTATSGATGLTKPLPVLPRRFYLVAGRNGCGVGPQ